jgi:hypothetical protein
LNRKIRLVGGPFGGKVMDSPNFGRNVIILTGPKRMTRRQQYDWFVNNVANPTSSPIRPQPRVQAKYELCIGPFVDSSSINNTNTMMANMVMAPLRHPDGSLFYKYIEGSKREFS